MKESLDEQWDRVEQQLQDLHEFRVVDCDPVKREGELLAELDRLEYEAGLVYLAEQEANVKRDRRYE